MSKFPAAKGTLPEFSCRIPGVSPPSSVSVDPSWERESTASASACIFGWPEDPLLLGLSLGLSLSSRGICSAQLAKPGLPCVGSQQEAREGAAGVVICLHPAGRGNPSSHGATARPFLLRRGSPLIVDRTRFCDPQR